MDEILSFAREYINRPAFRTKERKAKIRDAIRKLTGRKLDNGCGTCYIEALFQIINLTTMASSKYELKKGVLLQAFGHPEKTVTALTITDEIGDWYMANYPQKMVYFARYPKPTAPVIPAGVEILPAVEKAPLAEKLPEAKPLLKTTNKRKR